MRGLMLMALGLAACACAGAPGRRAPEAPGRPTPDRELIADWTEFSLAVGTYTEGGSFGSIALAPVTVTWPRIYWTFVEGGARAGQGWGAHALTTPGYPLFLDDQRRHQLRFGLGLGYQLLGLEGWRRHTLELSPTVAYVCRTGSAVTFGLGIRLMLPVASTEEVRADELTAVMVSGTIGFQRRYPGR